MSNNEDDSKKKHLARKWMRGQLRHNRAEYDDCGEVNSTKLAEDCAQEFNLYGDDPDATIPMWVFDLAVTVSEP